MVASTLKSVECVLDTVDGAAAPVPVRAQAVATGLGMGAPRVCWMPRWAGYVCGWGGPFCVCIDMHVWRVMDALGGTHARVPVGREIVAVWRGGFGLLVGWVAGANVHTLPCVSGWTRVIRTRRCVFLCVCVSVCVLCARVFRT